MCQIFDDGEIVRDEQVGDAKFGLQFFQQIENLRLHGNVQRRGRLVADQQFRLHGQRPCNGDALALTTGKLMRVTRSGLGRQADLFEQGRDGRGQIGIARLTPRTQRQHAFGDDFAHPQPRIQRGEGILENHLHVPPRLAQAASGQPDQFAAAEPDRTGGGRNQLQQGLAHRRLAATGFANQRQSTTR